MKKVLFASQSVDHTDVTKILSVRGKHFCEECPISSQSVDHTFVKKVLYSKSVNGQHFVNKVTYESQLVDHTSVMKVRCKSYNFKA